VERVQEYASQGQRRLAKIEEVVESDEERAASELMDQVALLGEESDSEYSSDDSDEERDNSSVCDYSDKWFHPDNIGKNGTMSSKSSKTTKVTRPTNYLNEFQRNALTVTMCIIAIFLTIKVGSSPVPSINNAVDWTLNGGPYGA
jgi:hypothetical protein